MLLPLVMVFAMTRGARASVPTDAGGMTAYASDAFARALPEAKVTIKGPLLLEVEISSYAVHVRLDKVWDYCQREPLGCERALHGWVANGAASLREAATPVQKSNIRVVVRNSAYVESVRRIVAERHSDAILRPIAGDLWLVCIVDMPHGVRSLSKADIAKLGLSEGDAIALGKQNVAAALRPLKAVLQDLPPNGIGYINDDFYDASRLLFHDDWAELSKKMNGNLIVVVPSSNFLVYGDGRDPAALGAINASANEVARKSQGPISTSLLKWVPGGWEIVNSP